MIRRSLHTWLLAALVLVLLAFAAHAVDLRFGPALPDPRRAGETGTLSVDSTGQADLVWHERFIGRVADLPAMPSVIVRLRLQDGREWSADLGSARGRVVDEGRLSTTTRHWSQLHRRGEPSLLGVHLFAERRADGVTLLSLAISNAALDPAAPNEYPGGLFFGELRVDVGRGSLIPDLVRKGEARDGARSFVIARGQHYFPPRAHLNRRFALVPNPLLGTGEWERMGREALDLQGLVLTDELPHFGGAKLVLPPIDRDRVEASAAAKLARVRAALAAGSPDPPSGLQTAALGPFHPAGWDVAGAVGGDGIEFLSGWQSTRSGVLLRRVLHDLEAERHPVALYHARTGDPLVRLPTPVDYRLTRGWAKVTALPWTVRAPANQWDDSRAVKDWNAGTCAYRARLLAYMPHDGQHLVRATRNGEAAWWLGRDWLARLDLEMVAADARYAWTLHPAPPSGDYVPPGLSVALNAARAKPGQGSPPLGREFGWVANAWAIDLAAAGGSAGREEKLAHAHAALELAGLVAMPTGLTQRLSQGSFWGSPDPWLQDGMPSDVDVSQWVLEPPIVALGMTGLARVAARRDGAAAERVGWIVAQSARSAYLNPAVPPVPTPWNAGVFGIAKWGAVAKKGGAVFDPVPFARGGSDPSNSWTHLALAWEWTRDGAFLDAMNRLGGPVADRAARLASFGRVELTQTATAVSALNRARETDR